MIRMRGFWAAAVAATLALAAPARVTAAPIGYAIDTSQNLFSIDLGTATATLIGPTGAGFFESLAVSPGGALYGADTGGNLYSINTGTGAATFIGSTGLGNIEGMDFNGSTLLAADFNTPTTIYSINTATAVPTPVVTSDVADGPTRAFAVQNATTGFIVTDTPTFQTLQRIDLTTGVTTAVGTITGFVAAIDFDGSGTLYGLDGSGNVYTIDPTTGAQTLVGNTGENFWLALAIPADTAAVPEPTTLALAGTGLATGLLARLRRRRAAGA
ncbi:MAG: DUF4394 domain-containing protein [Gemmataceae bacterium]|nr:DUF4394 domain-containing protein [Gemmataceae bacterium]